MAAVEDTLSFSWCLQIGPDDAGLFAATTDLTDAADVSALGAVYTKRIKNLDAVLTQAMPDLFFGIDLMQNITFVLDNSDGVLSSGGGDGRLIPVVLRHYNRITRETVIDFVGLIVDAQFVNTECILTLGSANPGLFSRLLPAATISAEIGSPFAKTSTPGAPVPVVFGGDVLVQCPNAANDEVSDPGGMDLLAGFGALQVPRVFAENPGTPNSLTQESEWTTAPGNPTFIDSTHFSVTNAQAVAYLAPPAGTSTTASGTLGGTATAHDRAIHLAGLTPGDVYTSDDFVSITGDAQVYRLTGTFTVNGSGEIVNALVSPRVVVTSASGTAFTITTSVISTNAFLRARFRTTASGKDWVYSTITAYDSATNHVTIADAVLDSGFNSLEVNGDYAVVPYTNVTAGLLPEPAGGQTLTAIRTWSSASSPTALVRSSGFESSSRYPSSDIQQILTNQIWGLSAGDGAAQTVNASSFSVAATALSQVGTTWGAHTSLLASAVNGALGYDQHQREATGPINEILMMRGMRLWQDANLAWNIEVDTQPANPSVKFILGPGDSSAIKIKRVVAHGFKPLDQAIRNVVLHWSVGGSSGGAALVSTKRFTPRDYGRTSTASVTGFGQDKHYYSQFINDQTTAELVAYYLSQKLQGADEGCTIEVGVEARDVALNQAVTITVASDGISGDWQVVGIQRTLTGSVLTCIRLNTDAYGQPSGVVTSNVAELGAGLVVGLIGTNEIPNPDFSAPILEPTGFAAPHDWDFLPPSISTFPSNGTFTASRIDPSAAVKAQTLSGHYWRITISPLDVPAPADPFNPAASLCGIFTSLFSPVQVNSSDMLRLVSIYCDQTDGIYAVVSEFDAANNETSRLLPLTYLATDTNALGWGRFYSPWRPRPQTTQAFLGFCVSRAGTFQFEAVDCRRVGRAATKPPPWQRHRAAPPTLFATGTVTFNGSTNALGYALTNLIPAGATVVSGNGIVTADITLGTAVGYLIGLNPSSDAFVGNLNLTPRTYATNVSVDSITTTPGSFTNAVYFPIATTVYVVGVTADGTPGATITSGSLRVQVEYTLGAPVSAD
jgi:hypothetical protein